MPASDYERIEQAILFLESNAHRRPSLAEAAAAVGLSEFHFQRLFTRWAGVSPKRFLQFLTAEHARRLLRPERSLFDVADEAGLSGQGRLHDLFVRVHAVTPGEYRDEGAGLVIRYGFHDSPFGACLLATTDRGLCGLAFLDADGRAAALADLRARWRRAELLERPEETEPVARRVFSRAPDGPPLALHLRGTNFQLKVWEALLRIPPGSAASYESVAARIGEPRAVRAVGTAVGQNPVAYLIPCHRVLRKTGHFGHYRWGDTRKRLILGREAGERERESGGVGEREREEVSG